MESQQSDDITEKEIFIEQMYETFKAGKIRDFDTDWRMANKIMPRSLECIHKQDSAEISGSYRKIHLSDIIAAARDIVNHYHRRAPKRESGIEALKRIKELVVGEKIPGWRDDVSTTMTRVAIADICDIALSKEEGK